jgi:ATP-dependent protease Clp ATPase subunit
MPEQHDLRCRFCGASEQHSEGLSAGFNVFICKECIDVSMDASIEALLDAITAVCHGHG